MKLQLFFILFSCLTVVSSAQTTREEDDQNKPKSPVTKTSDKHKVLIVPFSNRLYLSEIDHVINAETKQTQKEIRWQFKDGLDAALFKQLKSKFEVVSLIDDTAKNKNELRMIEASVGYKYDKIPDQNNYKAPKSDYKQELQVKNGQIIDEVNNDQRFMNARINDKELLSKLNKKYNADVFIFINELDIKAAPQTNDFNADKNRTAIIHYTVFDLHGKEINSGIVTIKFPKNVNDPAKISSAYFSKAMNEIVSRVHKALQAGSVITGQ